MKNYRLSFWLILLFPTPHSAMFCRNNRHLLSVKLFIFTFYMSPYSSDYILTFRS